MMALLADCSNVIFISIIIARMIIEKKTATFALDGYAKTDDLTFRFVLLLAEMKLLCHLESLERNLKVCQESMDKSLDQLGTNAAPVDDINSLVSSFLMSKGKDGKREIDELPKRIEDCLFAIRQQGNGNVLDNLEDCIPFKPVHAPSLFARSEFSRLGDEGLPNLEDQPPPVELFMIYQDTFMETPGMASKFEEFSVFDIEANAGPNQPPRIPEIRTDLMQMFSDMGIPTAIPPGGGYR